MATKIKIKLICMTSLAMASCSEFMDRDTYDSVSAEHFFASEKDIELYANGFVQRMIPSVRTIGYADNVNAEYCAVNIAGELVRTGGNLSPVNQGGWTEDSWSDLRNINYFLENMVKARDQMSEEVYNHYVGVGRFWRAWFYYGKVTTFGAVPYYDFVVKSNDTEALYKTQDPREYVMEKVLEDLDFAAEHCLTGSRYVAGGTGISKWVVLAFKSRVCLFEGTYRKYHSVDPSTGLAWENRENNIQLYLNEAVKAAEEIMNQGVYSLVTGDRATAYRSLFTGADIKTQEVIWGRGFSRDLSIFHDLSWVYYSPTFGNKASLTKRFMNTYLRTDGTPFTALPNYSTIEFKDEFTDRDYRMAQTVISPAYRMTVNGIDQPYAPNWLTTRTGYQPIKWSHDNDADNVFMRSASWNALPILRYAEVLLNYAEAKAELGEMGVAEWNRSIALLRDRAGVASIVPASPDPYMMQYFRNQVNDRWILEVRRERGIELCLEMGLRWDDLMRWRMGDLLGSDENPWTGVYIPNQNAQYDFNGDGIIDFYIGTVETSTSVPLSPGSTNQTFSFNNDNNLVWHFSRTWNEYKYLRPIPIDAITRNPNLKQNHLWEGR